MIEIKNRYTNEVILKLDVETLIGADLSHANLEEANLSHADLYNANLSHADLYNANLSNINLFNADLSHADLSCVNLSYTYLSEANLSHANLSHADLSHADLSNANLYNTNLSHADLSCVNLSNTNLSNTNLSNTNLSNTNLSNAKNINYKFRSNLNILKLQKNLLVAYKFLCIRGEKYISPYQNFEYKIGEEYISKNANDDIFSLYGAGINIATLEWCLLNREVTNIIGEFSFNPKDLIIPFNSDGKFRIKDGGRVKFNRVLLEKEIEELLKL